MMRSKTGDNLSKSKKAVPIINNHFHSFVCYLAFSFGPYSLKPGYEGIKL